MTKAILQASLYQEKHTEYQDSAVLQQTTGNRLWKTQPLFHLPDLPNLTQYLQMDSQIITLILLPTTNFHT